MAECVQVAGWKNQGVGDLAYAFEPVADQRIVHLSNLDEFV